MLQTIEIARVLDGAVRLDRLRIPTGATLGQALEAAVASGLVDTAELGALEVAVFGLRKPPGYPLHPGDRIELVAALKVDPKVARQRRVAKRRATLARDKWAPDRRQGPTKDRPAAASEAGEGVPG